VAGTGGAATPQTKELGDRIKRRRDQLGISQEDLAARADIDRSYVGTVENGFRNPALNLLGRLAIGLEVDLGDLVQGLERYAGRPKRPHPKRKKVTS
jgi:transcriptional regulator with XRE-family HTH domain